MDVVKSNFFVLGLKPDFRIADADELEILAEEASLEAVEELYNEGNSDFLHLTDCYSDKRGDAAIIDMALSLLNFSESMPYPVKWICDVCEEYNLPDDESFLSLPSSVFTISCVISHLKAALDMLIHGKSLCSEANGLEKYISVFDDDIIFLSAALKAAEGDISAAWNDLFNMICTRTYRNLPPVRGADATDKETVSNIRKAAN